MSQIASDAKISSAMAALGMTAPLPNLDDSQVLKAILVALGNITGGGGGGGTGDVVGPASSTAGNAAVFASGTGKLLADSGIALTAAAVGFTIAGGTTSKTLTVLNTGTAALLEVANNFTVAGAANAPAMTLSGTIFAGGTGTSTKPLFLIEPTGTTASSVWSTSGTAFGINVPSGVGALVDLQVKGLSFFKLIPDVPAAGASALQWGAHVHITNFGGKFSPNGTTNVLGDGSDPNRQWNGVVIRSAAQYQWSTDTGLARSGAGAVKVTDGSSGFGSLIASAITVNTGGALQLGNAAVTGLVAGALAALTTASIVIYDSTGTAYRVPCVTP